MKTLALLISLTLFGAASFAQGAKKDTLSMRELSEDGSRYRASNGKTYEVGATIQLGAGTASIHKSFKHVCNMIGNLVMPTLNLDSRNAGEEVTITEFKREKMGKKRLYAIVKEKFGKYAVFIEAGLATGEVK